MAQIKKYSTLIYAPQLARSLQYEAHHQQVNVMGYFPSRAAFARAIAEVPGTGNVASLLAGMKHHGSGDWPVDEVPAEYVVGAVYADSSYAGLPDWVDLNMLEQLRSESPEDRQKRLRMSLDALLDQMDADQLAVVLRRARSQI